NVHGTQLADLATALTVPADRNCFADNQYGTSAPRNIEQLMPCTGTSAGDVNEGAIPLDRFFDTSKNLQGRAYRDTPVPATQPRMPRARTAPARPAAPPTRVDVSRIAL